MIVRRFVPGGWYAAARPDGSFAVLVTNRHILTHRGNVALPKDQNLLFVDIAPDGERFAGSGGRDDRAWLWDGADWTDEGGAYGAHAVLFDDRGGLYVNHNHALPTGVRQWADDGSLVTCEQTYADAKVRLYEFTTRDGIRIGQGGESGVDGADPLVAILEDGTARLLQVGTCRAVRFYRVGDSIALAWWQEDRKGAGLLWAKVQDIQNLPVYTRQVLIPKIGRPCWVGFINFLLAQTPGNCYLNTSDMIVRGWDGSEIARFVEGSPDGDLAAINRAVVEAGDRLPVIAYWPKSLHRGPLPNAPIVGVEAYCGKDESLVALESRIRQAIARVPKVVLVAQCFTSNVGLTPSIDALVPVYARIARDCRNVWGVLAFSGAGRPSGLQDHASARPLWQRLAEGASKPEIDTMNKPKVTVTKFDGLFKPNGWHFTTTDGNGQTIDTFTKDGVIHQRITNAVGMDEASDPKRRIA